MKGNIKQNLERIIDFIKSTGSFVKSHSKEALMIVSLGGGYLVLDKLAQNAYAGKIETRASVTSNPGSQPIGRLKVNNGDLSGDVLYIEPMHGDIGTYFKREETKLKEKVIDSNNMSAEDMWAEKNGGASSGDEYWLWTILNNSQGENHLLGRNVFAYRYGQDGVNDPCAIPEDTLDVWYNNGNWVQSGSFTGIDSGLYDRVRFESFHQFDLNRNGEHDWCDASIEINRWLRTEVDKGSEPNDLGAYADINGDGDIDYEDFAILYNARQNAPNIW